MQEWAPAQWCGDAGGGLRGSGGVVMRGMGSGEEVVR